MDSGFELRKSDVITPTPQEMLSVILGLTWSVFLTWENFSWFSYPFAFTR